MALLCRKPSNFPPKVKPCCTLTVWLESSGGGGGERTRKSRSERSQEVIGAGHCQPLGFSLNGTETIEEFGTWGNKNEIVS